ncbi:hypothetical protein N799_07290 [Lysobacter arseniciresistens ZS79]|uniref:Uncharacterized protein n=1 Tax=Lysobacter arseniciresistens ZS79 TaxID=913325 RepID=A0A0A0EYQ7_9GAMM|nr:hypothetical protein [Lysobacter arseniciresistens]KGM55375.1 hypothetical protein N799_07290 [Lysobacter arseniciresistens ZS79]
MSDDHKDIAEVDFRELTFPDGYQHDPSRHPDSKPVPLEFRGGDPAALEMLGGGGSVLHIPPDMMGIEARRLWERIKIRMLLGMAPATPSEWLIRSVLAELRKSKSGRKIKVNAVFAGVTLAIARTHGVPIPTHERDIARDVQTRYTTLIRVRKLATQMIEARGINLHLPEWLKADWSP